MDKKFIKRKEIGAVLEIPTLKNAKTNESRQRDEVINYSKNILLEKGLSVTALNHFMESPVEFFRKSILKLPEPPSQSSEKGNAMHEAFALLWHLKNKNDH